MVEWAFILTPLLVLPILFLFRFVGCAQIAGLEEPDPVAPQPDNNPPNYRGYILGDPKNPGSVKNSSVVPKGANVIGYWRLVDAAGSTVARDEKGFQDGKYRTSVDPDVVPGNFVTGLTSLIASDPGAMGRFFNGGYVLIPAKAGLFTEEFTIEAWVRPGFAAGAEHTLFHAGGHYSTPSQSAPTYQGFRVFATEDRSWQVSLSPGGNVFKPPPIIPPGDDVRTHLAVTIEQVKVKPDLPTVVRKVTIFIDGKKTAENTVAFYSVADGAPLLIGVAGEEQEPHDLETLPQPDVAKPFRSRVQEVVLHKKALPPEEIENHVDINR
jgi:Concanavalin A-like lectin/glucanases superfamily